MLKSIISVIAISLLLWGCAAPTYFKDSSWTEQPTSVKVVYVNPTISNPQQLTDGLPEYKDNLGKWFENVVTEKMDEESRKKVKTSIELVDASALSVQIVKLGEKDFEAPAYASMNGADVYLVLSNIWFGCESEEYMTVQGNQASMAMQTTPYSGVSAYNFFKAKARYAFYDAKTGKILAYGVKEGKASLRSIEVTGSDWDYATRALIGDIVAFTPVVRW
ncbi:MULTISPECIES: hypothetical protein [unclassified Fibrobacter]|uniref:hypothetical protein n=1 Tax=unclassified Fibrobacter TaxID=2634177 RepID=UPI000D6D2327|nr:MULTISPECIES: hypothetical protein [unclassified Fibrobacter]PWJ71643.1 hypothetical protein BGX12_1025 [Fibrobacter sp. UWR4]PZW65087.1 hypothetical protein C8E88_10365 [Fibrobacter sp. UWR1]